MSGMIVNCTHSFSSHMSGSVVGLKGAQYFRTSEGGRGDSAGLSGRVDSGREPYLRVQTQRYLRTHPGGLFLPNMP